MPTSAESARDMGKNFLKAAGCAVAAYGLGTGTVWIVENEHKQKTEVGRIAANDAGKRFDIVLDPLLSSPKPLSVEEIDKADPQLGTCLLRQNPTSITILQNWSLTSSTQFALDRPKLRDCYAQASAAHAIDERDIIPKIMVMLITALGSVAGGIGTLGYLGATGFSAAQFADRRRKEKQQEGPKPSA